MEPPLYPFFLFDCKLSDERHLSRVLDAMGLCEEERRHVKSRWVYIHRTCRRDPSLKCYVRCHREAGGHLPFLSPAQSCAVRQLDGLMNTYSSMPFAFRFHPRSVADASRPDSRALRKQRARHVGREFTQQLRTLNSIAEDAPHVELLESDTNPLKMYDKPSDASLEEMERLERDWKKERRVQNNYWERYFFQRQRNQMREATCSPAAVEADRRRLETLEDGAEDSDAVPLSSVRLPSTLPDEDNLSEAETASSASYFTSRWLPPDVGFDGID